MPLFFDRKLIYIHIPKCGGMSICEALEPHQQKFVSTGQAEFHRRHESLRELHEILDNKAWNEAVAFSTIRDPAARLASWYQYSRNLKIEHQKIHAGKMQVFDGVGSSLPYLPLEYGKIRADGEYYKSAAIRLPENSEDEATTFVKQELLACDCALSFIEATFKEWVGDVAAGRGLDCPYLHCSYKPLASQCSWLADHDGIIDFAKLHVFSLERLQELQEFLPDMTRIGRENYTGKGDQIAELLDFKTARYIRQYYEVDYVLQDRVRAIRAEKELAPINFTPPESPRNLKTEEAGKCQFI